MDLIVKKSDKSRQKDSHTNIKQISEYLSLEEGVRISQKKIKYFDSAKIENVYYWAWKYETDDPFQMYAIVHREREKQFSQPKYIIGSCSDNNVSSFEEMLITYHQKNGNKSVDN